MSDNKNDDLEKTLEPSPQKIEKETKKGNIVKSIEIINWFMISGFLLTIVISSSIFYNLVISLDSFLYNSHTIPLNAEGISIISKELIDLFLSTLAPVFTIACVLAILGHVVQNRPRFTQERIKMKLSKISPFAGVKRLFSKQGVIHFTSGIIKITIITGVIASLLWSERSLLGELVDKTALDLLVILKQQVIIILSYVLGLLFIVVVLDYSYQYSKWHKALRMTHQEKRDENKEMEGDPKIRSRFREIRSRNQQKNLTTRIKQASVLVTNPTHFAVALNYEVGMDTPICSAKGKDHIAIRMRQIARENNIPIIENPPLARILYKEVEIDERIKPQHYQAVASIINTVMRLDTKKL